ncbi:MAG: hypothetical protein EP333_03345 [Bacteroidetes bacterium]|nr:MAG: hypothetical protein EP333_03345 [Bacteroidota bacterium]TNE97613.1 MAG: hypothetical protein EP322_06350 [Bacteroidota bacterium]
MIAEASIVGVFRTILILIGALVVLRFIGQLMQAKRNMEEEREMNRRSRHHAQEREQVNKNFGKTRVVDHLDSKNGVEDVDFEEVE